MITTPAPTTTKLAQEETPLARIQEFARSASFETTRLSPAELDEVKATAIPG